MKRLKKSLGIMVFISIIGHYFISCPEPDGGDKSNTTNFTTTNYSNTISGTTYNLTITHIDNRSAIGDDYELIVTRIGSEKISTGKIITIGQGNLAFQPNDSSSPNFEMGLSGGNITHITGTITFNDGTSEEGPGSFAINAQIPTISSQPDNATVTINVSHSITVSANITDGGTLSYQWYENSNVSNSDGTPINGASSASYNPLTNEIGIFYYFVEVTNKINDNGDGGNKTATIRSNAITLNVNMAINAQSPIIISQSVDATVNLGGNHNLSVVASSSDGGTLAYQWFRNTSASNADGTPITGATTEIYSPPTGIEGTYYYFVEITNIISDNGDGGIKITTVRSNFITLTVNVIVNSIINFTQLQDLAPNITGPTIRLAGSLLETNKAITIINPNQYDNGSIKWYFNGNQIIGSTVSGVFGETLILSSSIYNKVGIYFITLEVKKDGKFYSKVINFTVEL